MKVYANEEERETMKKRLLYLENEEIPRVAKIVQEARALGDLRENAEYHAAKKRLAMVSRETDILRDQLMNIVIIDKEDIDTTKVTIRTKVTLEKIDDKRTITYQLVSPAHANIQQKKISADAPVGKQLLGKKVGEEVEVQTPRGPITYKVKNITA